MDNLENNNHTEVLSISRPLDRRLWNRTDWVDYINSVGFNEISFASFKRALESKIDNDIITYFFDGEEVASYNINTETNQAPLRQWYNNKSQ